MHKIMWNLQHSKHNYAASIVYIWTSQCGRYRLHRICNARDRSVTYGAEFKDGSNWCSVETTMTSGFAPVYYNSLRRALEVVESHLTKKSGKSPEPGNSEELITSAKNLDQEIGTKTREEEKEREKKKREDSFGYRLGTKESKFNACLSTKAKTMQEILEEAGIKEKMFDHLIRLKQEGWVEKVEGGWRLAKRK